MEWTRTYLLLMQLEHRSLHNGLNCDGRTLKVEGYEKEGCQAMRRRDDRRLFPSNSWLCESWQECRDRVNATLHAGFHSIERSFYSLSYDGKCHHHHYKRNKGAYGPFTDSKRWCGGVGTISKLQRKLLSKNSILTNQTYLIRPPGPCPMEVWIDDGGRQEEIERLITTIILLNNKHKH